MRVKTWLSRTAGALIVLATVGLLYSGADRGVIKSDFIRDAQAQVPSFTPPLPTFQTYMAGFQLAVPQTAAGDAVCLTGSATRVVRPRRIILEGINATAQTSVVNLNFHTTADTGGTSSTPTITPIDSTNPAATAVLRAYTVIPTPGTSTTVSAREFIQQAAATGTFKDTLGWEWRQTEFLYQPLTLRGITQQLCLNFPNAFTTNGPTIQTEWTFTEQ